MSEEEFKYPVDLSKIKNNKLFNKFVKSLEKEPSKPKNEEVAAKPIEYNTAYQNKSQVAERATLIKPVYGNQLDGLPEDNSLSVSNVFEAGTRRSEVEYRVEVKSAAEPQIPFQDILPKQQSTEQQGVREGRQRGAFRAEFSNRQFNSQPPERPKQVAPPPVYVPPVEEPPVMAKPPPQPIVQSIQESDKSIQEYKLKLERLSQAFEEFKKNSIDENRQRKAQILGYQEQIEIIKEKVNESAIQMYDVQSREDGLILENQRLKQKVNAQTVLRTRLEEQNKQLDYKVQQLTDMLESREAALRKKSDEATHWKSQTESLKAQMHNLRLSNQRLALSLSEYEEEQQFLKRQKENKDSLQVDMKEKVALLIRENARLKDEMHFLTMKMNNLENENYLLRTDIKRQNNLTQVLSSHPDQQPQRVEHQQPQGREPRRRGQFNRERERANETRQNHRSTVNTPINQHSENDQRKQQMNPDRQLNELIQQQKVVESEVQKLRDLKSMSGAMRKRKIELERELESINIKIVELRGEGK